MTEVERRVEKAKEHRRRQIEIGKKVHEMVSNGRSNAEIAKEIGLSENVVRHIRSNIEGGKYNGKQTEA